MVTAGSFFRFIAAGVDVDTVVDATVVVIVVVDDISCGMKWNSSRFASIGDCLKARRMSPCRLQSQSVIFLRLRFLLSLLLLEPEDKYHALFNVLFFDLESIFRPMQASTVFFLKILPKSRK